MVEQWIREKNRKRRRRLLEADADVRGFHSRSYHRHFEDYVEYRRLMPDGRTKLIRQYAGKWYRQKLSGKQYVMIRILYLTMFVLMSFLFRSAAVSAGAGGASRSAAVAGCVSVLLLSVMAYELLVNYIFAPRRMTVGEYKSCTKSFKIVSVGLAASFVADALSVFIYIILHSDRSGVGEVSGVIKFLVCAGLASALFMTERKLVYEEAGQTADIPEDAVEITAGE